MTERTDKTDVMKIDNLDAPELDLYARLSETELLRLNEPDRGVFIAESPRVIERALQAGCVPISILCEERQAEESGRLIRNNMHLLQMRDPEGQPGHGRRIPVYTAPFDVLTRLTGFALTRGMLCAMYRPDMPSVEDICRGAARIAVLEQDRKSVV